MMVEPRTRNSGAAAPQPGLIAKALSQALSCGSVLTLVWLVVMRAADCRKTFADMPTRQDNWRNYCPA
jgi:hypothetical protein